MSAKYWIKLYHEILYDRKMATMRSDLWQRTIQMFLIAGEEDRDGNLPSIDDIAFTLRMNKEQLETDMVELQSVGILSINNGQWYVTKFSERQAKMDKAEYMRRKRDENQTAQYYGYQPVTNGNADKIRIDTDKNREEEIEEEIEDVPVLLIQEKDNDMDVDETLRFQWSIFKEDMPDNVRVNYASKCTPIIRDGRIVLLCESEEVAEYARSRWHAALSKAFYSQGIEVESER